MCDSRRNLRLLRFVITEIKRRAENSLPDYEYETEKEPGAEEGLAVVIEVESLQWDMGNTNLFGSVPSADADEMSDNFEGSGEQSAPDESSAEGDGVYTLVSEGTLSRQDGLLQLTYLERIEDEDGAAPTKVCIAFPIGSSSHVTVSRSGEINTVFTVEPNVRQYSTYETPFGQVDLCVIGKKIENGISESGGTMQLDYAVELRGMVTQRTKMTIRVRPEHKL